jgi:hopanoid biosynthesis associated RND transporter like protein HpnN
VLETMRGVGASLVLCAVTTAAGFYAFVPTAFEGVSELGLIAGTGVLLSMLTSVTLLPALLVALPRAERAATAPAWLSSRPLAAASARPRAALAVTLAVGAAAILVLPAVCFDNNPINLRDPRTESVATLRDLAASGEAPLFRLAAIAPDRATAERWAEALAALPEVRAVATSAALVPSEQTEKIAILEDTALLLGGELGDLAKAPADPAALAESLRALAGTDADNVARSRAAADDLLESLNAAAPAERERVLRALDESLAAGLPPELARLDRGLSAQPFGREALPDALRERWIGAGGRELVEIAPAEDVSDNSAAERFIAAVRSVVPTATGLPVVYQEASATVVGAFRQALGLALLMVVLIVWLFLRSWRDMLLVVVPILVAATVTAGATVWLGLPFNYANIIALPLLVGIGVDNGIHVVHRLRSETSTAVLFETSTMDAVLASGLTTVASFGTLAFSAHVGTASMGKLLAVGLVASMAATLVVLPAWLAFRAQRRAALLGAR